jgi:hypothetical protein
MSVKVKVVCASQFKVLTFLLTSNLLIYALTDFMGLGKFFHLHCGLVTGQSIYIRLNKYLTNNLIN